ncbi:MAG: response regulator transcription factor [Peptococcaceae bacterium]|nr:response regulator transcription factor [Peptococcaceae bacterium]
MSGINIMIVDDHPMIREGLATMLSAYEDINIVGSCGSGDEALEFINKTIPDVVLMDIKMGKMNGIEATQEMVSRVPGIKVIMLTIYEDPESVRLSLQAGATGYILKQASQEKLAESIRRAYRGETVIDPSLLGQLVNDYARMAQGFTAHPKSQAIGENKDLTPREEEVLSYLAQGLTNKEISAKTHLAVDTVKTHLRSIYRKLGVKNRSQAISKIARKNKSFYP